jgi:hypothetical protein
MADEETPSTELTQEIRKGGVAHNAVVPDAWVTVAPDGSVQAAPEHPPAAPPGQSRAAPNGGAPAPTPD